MDILIYLMGILQGPELFTRFNLFICFTMSYMVIGLRKKEVILFEINELLEQLWLLDGLLILLAHLEPIVEK